MISSGEVQISVKETNNTFKYLKKSLDTLVSESWWRSHSLTLVYLVLVWGSMYLRGSKTLDDLFRTGEVTTSSKTISWASSSSFAIISFLWESLGTLSREESTKTIPSAPFELSGGMLSARVLSAWVSISLKLSSWVTL